jgi:hypothetical protein
VGYKMAIYIRIRKTFENESFADYVFGKDMDQSGKLRVMKKTGEVTLLKDIEENGADFVFLRASRKIQLHWRNAEFPEKTCWAS